MAQDDMRDEERSIGDEDLLDQELGEEEDDDLEDDEDAEDASEDADE
jgi:hypothetical protein